MNENDQKRLVRVEEGVKYMRKKLDSLCSMDADVKSLKGTQKNIRRGIWIAFAALFTSGVALVTTGLTYILKGIS